MARPNGVLSAPFLVTTLPVPALVARTSAAGIAVILFPTLSATNSVPWELRPRPVGPTTRAAGSVCSPNPDPTTVCAASSGGLPPRSRRVRRSTVPWLTVAPPAATVPLRTLLTNSAASEPPLTVAMSQGPLMPCPAMVSATCPLLLTTSRHPACAVAPVPSVVGRLPTTTQPPGRIPRAVVRPTPPGHRPGSEEASICANSVCWPPGEICTIVVPVPCRFAELLKLLTRTSPLTRLPVLVGTTATP